MATMGDFKDVITVENWENYVCHVTNNMIKCLSGVNVFEN